MEHDFGECRHGVSLAMPCKECTAIMYKSSSNFEAVPDIFDGSALEDLMTGAEVNICLEALYDLLKASRNNQAKQTIVNSCIKKLEKRQ